LSSENLSNILPEIIKAEGEVVNDRQQEQGAKEKPQEIKCNICNEF
jgi:hypothetical protein